MNELMEKIEIAGIHIDCPVMNGAGSCRTIEEVKNLGKSCVSIIVAGSFTIEEREENKGNNFWFNDQLSLNSRGLPNQGIKYLKEVIPDMVLIAHGFGKLLCISVAGFSSREYAVLAKLAFELGADMVELDLGCPNIWKDGKQEKIACFEPDLVREILRIVQEAVGLSARVFVKLSPILDSYLLKEVVDVISQFDVVKAVVSMNTVPNACLFNDKGRPIITVGQGLAGLSGPAIKPIAIGQVIQLRSLLPENIDIVYAGGVTHGKDILDAHRAGVKVAQITSYLLQFAPEFWPDVFTRLMSQYIE
jgi:dihydroorotate dehydrogenase (fumarate)